MDIVAYTAVDDCGHALDHMIVEGQLHGAVAQGLGQALMEKVVYDDGSGQLVTGSFMDYAMPRADDMPPIRDALLRRAGDHQPARRQRRRRSRHHGGDRRGDERGRRRHSRRRRRASRHAGDRRAAVGSLPARAGLRHRRAGKRNSPAADRLHPIWSPELPKFAAAAL